MTDRIIRKKDAAKMLGVSFKVLDRLEAKGQFPKKIKISERAVGWLESEISNYIATRIVLRRLE